MVDIFRFTVYCDYLMKPAEVEQLCSRCLIIQS